MRSSHGTQPHYHFRRTTESDAGAVAEVYLRSRKEMVTCAPLAHSDESVRDWVRGQLIPRGNVTVVMLDGVIVGFVAISQTAACGWIDQLYVLPAYIRRGVGTALLDHARNALQPPIRLYTFQCNDVARHFYEHHGFKPLEYSDGSNNEENCPDILYEWRPE